MIVIKINSKNVHVGKNTILKAHTIKQIHEAIGDVISFLEKDRNKAQNTPKILISSDREDETY